MTMQDSHVGYSKSTTSEAGEHGASEAIELDGASHVAGGANVLQSDGKILADTIAEELRRETFESLQPVSLGGAILWALFVPFHMLDLPAEFRSGAMLADVGMVLASLALYVPLRLNKVRVDRAGLAALLFASANSLAVLYIYWLTGQAVQSFYVGVILIAAGSMILMTRWWAASSIFALGAWAFVVTQQAAGSELANLFYVQASAVMVGIAAHIGRRKSTLRVCEFRLRDMQRERKLQALFEETDSARRELDTRVSERTQELQSAYDDLSDQARESTRLESERGRLEAELQHAQRLESVGQLAGGIAHDFNNLLTVIAGNMDLLLELSDTLDETQKSCLADARAAADRATTLTRELLAYSRKQPVVLSTLNPMEIIEGVRSMVEQAANVNVDLNLTVGEIKGRVRAGRGQIEQVVMNLVMNACDAMPAGGRLEVDLDEVDRLPDLSFDGEGADSFIRLRVTDTGKGMDEETQGRALEPFFTTKEVGKGTGLGLAVADGIVKQHRGHLTFSSVLGEGSTFTVYLPCTPGSVQLEGAEPFNPTSDLTYDGAALTVLLAEDEPAVRRFTRILLEELGHTVLVAEGGEEALSLSKGHAGAIELLVTDVMMPGMVGTELAMKLKHGRPDLRVLLISGYTDPAGVAELEDEVGMAFMRKPFTLSDLRVKLAGLMAVPTD